MTRELRRLDAEVAEALGWTGFYWRDDRGAPVPDWAPGSHLFGQPVTGRWSPQPVPRFSADIACAWPLAERFGLIVGPNYNERYPRWIATRGWQGLSDVWAEELTAPLAIVRAVLALARRGEGK